MRISDWSSDVCSSDLGYNRDDGRFGLDRTTTENGACAMTRTELLVLAAIPVFAVVAARPAPAQGPVALELVLVADGSSLEERRGGKECVRTGRSRWLTTL